jgi:hypothetical protein
MSTEPTLTDEQRAKKAFQTMWIAGSIGAFFSALTRNLPLHFEEFSRTPDFLYTLDRFLRYGYLLWLLAYFFTSNLRNNPATAPKRWEVSFDVLQSACALAAAFGLGFIAPGSGFSVDSYGWTMGVANAAILVISVFSLIWFRKVAREFNPHRTWGAVASALALLICALRLPRMASLVFFTILQLALWGILFSFIRKRLHPYSEMKAAPKP